VIIHFLDKSAELSEKYMIVGCISATSF